MVQYWKVPLEFLRHCLKSGVLGTADLLCGFFVVGFLRMFELHENLVILVRDRQEVFFFSFLIVYLVFQTLQV